VPLSECKSQGYNFAFDKHILVTVNASLDSAKRIFENPNLNKFDNDNILNLMVSINLALPSLHQRVLKFHNLVELNDVVEYVNNVPFSKKIIGVTLEGLVVEECYSMNERLRMAYRIMYMIELGVRDSLILQELKHFNKLYSSCLLPFISDLRNEIAQMENDDYYCEHNAETCYYPRD
jgi:uncharacterized protein YabN with tetrapyrrole methylase and pyrophosphatase domain